MKINVVDKSAIDMVAHFLGKILVRRLKIVEFRLRRVTHNQFEWECIVYYKAMIYDRLFSKRAEAHNKGAMAAVRGALTLVAKDLLK